VIADPGSDGETVGPFRLGAPLQSFPYASIHRAVRKGQERPLLLWRFRNPYATAAGFVEALEQLAGDPRTRTVPGLVTVEEVGTVQEAEPLAFVVAGDAPGGFLVPALEARRAPGVFATAAALGSTLDAAHALGLVHGDVQPSTVVLDASGRPALVGLAIRTVVARVTPDADWMPSAAAFRPPERPVDSEADPAADRYGLAALVFYLLCGHSPTDGGELVPPSRWRSGVPARVDEVVLRALSRSPADRFPTASLFIAALTGSPAQLAPGAPPPPGALAPSAEPVREVAVADSGSVLPRMPPPEPRPVVAAASVPFVRPDPAPAPPPALTAEPARPGVTAPNPRGDLPVEAQPEADRRGRSTWLGVGVALVVGIIAAAAAVIYLLSHGTHVIH